MYILDGRAVSESMRSVLLSLLILLKVDDALCITNSKIEVPSAVLVGEPIEFHCDFDLELGERLDCVKWYKNNAEFYRYCPSERPEVKTSYSLPGIFVNTNKSDDKSVHLEKVTLQTEGTFACEVSTAGQYKTALHETDVSAYVIPNQRPVIRGIENYYEVGDLLNISCFAYPSKPSPKLKWYINNKKAPKEFLYKLPHYTSNYPVAVNKSHIYAHQGVSYQSRLRTGDVRDHNSNIKTSQLGLQFRITKEHLREGVLRLKCASIINKNISQAYAEVVFADGYKPSANDNPRITVKNLRPYYPVGAMVEVNCSSKVMQDRDVLHEWFINDEEVLPSDFRYYTLWIGRNQKIVQTVLKFTVRHEHYHKDAFSVRCNAVTSEPIVSESQETILVAEHHAFSLFSTSGSQKSSRLSLVSWMVFLAVGSVTNYRKASAQFSSILIATFLICYSKKHF